MPDTPAERQPLGQYLYAAGEEEVERCECQATCSQASLTSGDQVGNAAALGRTFPAVLVSSRGHCKGSREETSA